MDFGGLTCTARNLRARCSLQCCGMTCDPGEGVNVFDKNESVNPNDVVYRALNIFGEFYTQILFKSTKKNAPFTRLYLL